MSSQNHLKAVLKHLPAAQYAFAYGSGVLAQPGLYSQPQPTSASPAPAASKGPMLDFILAVHDPVAWHKQNMQQSPHHYSWLRSLGPEAVVAVASGVGVGVHFNPLVEINGQRVKYGVISVDDMTEDLSTWKRLYTAGRLHKPVATLVPDSHIDTLVKRNRHAAAVTALVLLPSQFTTEDLLRQVVGLSYHGDIRMGWAEDPHKIERILAGSRQPLQDLYVPMLQPTTTHAPPQQQQPVSTQAQPTTVSQEGSLSAPHSSSRAPAGQAAAVADSAASAGLGQLIDMEQLDVDTWRRPADADTHTQLVAHLAPSVLAGVARRVGFQVPETHCERGSVTALELAHAVVKTGRHQQLVSSVLRATVRESSLWQGVAAAISAGGGKAVTYITAKLTKAMKATAPQLKALEETVKSRLHTKY